MPGGGGPASHTVPERDPKGGHQCQCRAIRRLVTREREDVGARYQVAVRALWRSAASLRPLCAWLHRCDHHRSTSPKDIAEAIESVDEAQIRVRSVDGQVIGWALIIPDLSDGEDVADYSDNAYMNSFLS